VVARRSADVGEHGSHAFGIDRHDSICLPAELAASPL
jgi:hypothetical protein